MYYVYLLKLSGGKYYVGYSSNLKSRMDKHLKRRVYFTKDKNPQLVFYSGFERKKKALGFEKYLKSSSGFAFRNKRLI